MHRSRAAEKQKERNILGGCSVYKHATPGGVFKMLGAPPASPLRLNIDRRADTHQPQQILRVPVGQAETAVGFGTAYLLRARRAVDAVARFVQPNPNGADGIIR